MAGKEGCPHLQLAEAGDEDAGEFAAHDDGLAVGRREHAVHLLELQAANQLEDGLNTLHLLPLEGDHAVFAVQRGQHASVAVKRRVVVPHKGLAYILKGLHSAVRGVAVQAVHHGPGRARGRECRGDGWGMQAAAEARGAMMWEEGILQQKGR